MKCLVLLKNIGMIFENFFFLYVVFYSNKYLTIIFLKNA